MTDARLVLMHRYVEEYTNAHDMAVAREIMHPDYRFTMGGTTIDLPAYLGMVENALGHFTDLRLDVDSFIVDPDRLAMVFSESATSVKHGRRATWPGIALYDFHEDGRLARVTVEQDFWGRRRQFIGEAPQIPARPTDASVWTTAVAPGEPGARAMIESGLLSLTSQDDVSFDDGSPLMLEPTDVMVSDVIVSGRRFAVSVTIDGPYTPHPMAPPLAIEAGTPITITANGAGSLVPGSGISARFVTDRYGSWTRHRSTS
jgi:hypothetical protein